MEGNVVVVQNIHTVAKADRILMEKALELPGGFAGGVRQKKGEAFNAFFMWALLRDSKIGPLRDHGKTVGNGAKFL